MWWRQCKLQRRLCTVQLKMTKTGRASLYTGGEQWRTAVPEIVSCECGGGRGCGCIASSDFPDDCQCHCYGAAIGGGLTLGLNAFVDVSISVLPLLEAARFFDSVHSRRILVPADMLHKLNKRVHLKVKRKRFADVLKRLGLTTGGIRKKKRRSADDRSAKNVEPTISRWMTPTLSSEMSAPMVVKMRGMQARLVPRATRTIPA